MYHVLTEEEVKKMDEKYNEWWNSLDMGNKAQIFHFCDSILKSETLAKAVEEYKQKELDKWLVPNKD